MKHYSVFISALCCSFLLLNCGGRGSSSSSSTSESSSQTIQLEDYIIRLVPYYDDEPSQDYRMVDGKLVHIYSDSYKTVCGTVDRVNENAFEVGVGGDYQNGGKINPDNAAIFRGDKMIGYVAGNPYRFAVFDIKEGRIYQNTADYENRNISDVEYLKFKLFKPGELPSQKSQTTSSNIDLPWLYGIWSITTPFGTETLKIDKGGSIVEMLGLDINTGSYTIEDGVLYVKFSGESIVTTYSLDMVGQRIVFENGTYYHKKESFEESSYEEEGRGSDVYEDEEDGLGDYIEEEDVPETTGSPLNGQRREFNGAIMSKDKKKSYTIYMELEESGSNGSVKGFYRYLSQPEDKIIPLEGSAYRSGDILHLDLYSTSGTESFSLKGNLGETMSGTWRQFNNEEDRRNNVNAIKELVIFLTE